MTISITKEHNRFIPCSLHSDCNNVQKSALKSVNMQRTGKTILQMFAFPFFDGSHICRFLPILRPPTIPRSHFRHPKIKVFVPIIRYLYLQIVTSASGSDNNYLHREYNLNFNTESLHRISIIKDKSCNYSAFIFYNE